MTTYAAIANGDIDQDSAITQPLMTALRDNPIALAEGASGAPRISLLALERLTAGNVVIGEDLNTYSHNNSSPVLNIITFALAQKGSLRIKYNLKTTSAPNAANCEIVRFRRGDSVIVSTLNTSSTTDVNLSVDLTVQAGDRYDVNIYRSGGSGSSVLNTFQMCTSGELIYPAAYSPLKAI
jgi:hypothetical protein